METPIVSPGPQVMPPLPVPQSFFWRIAQGLVVTLLSLFAFIAVSILKPEWQDGRFSSYIALLLSPEASWIFAPLIIFSALSMLTLLLDNTSKQAQAFWVRLGVYTGTLLALQFTILALIAVGGGTIIVVGLWLGTLIAWYALRWASQKIGKKWTMLIVLGLAFFLYAGYILFEVINLGSFSPYMLSNPFFFLIGFLVGSAPFWTLLIMSTTSYRLLKHYETRFTLPRGLGVLAWLGGFSASWSLAILRTLQLYSELPTQPPDCYIATAAANGHPRFVGSQEVTLASGARMRVNTQLQRLKCAELALKAVAPHLHGLLRAVYDTLGRPLARRMTHPVVADAAYLLLKPFEWISIFVLRRIVPEINIHAQKLYRS